MRAVALLIPLLACAACSQAPQQETAGSASAASQDERPVPAAPAAASASGPDTPVASPAPAADRGGLARVDGYGALRFGMSEREARAAWEGGLQGDAVEPDNCAYLRPAADERFRIGFMFEGGVFVRYDVDVDSEIAPGGGRVGQARADIERAYRGRVEVRPHEYVPGGAYLRVTDPAIAGGALVFEADENGRVTRWRVGRAPQVDYVEGCA